MRAEVWYYTSDENYRGTKKCTSNHKLYTFLCIKKHEIICIFVNVYQILTHFYLKSNMCTYLNI